MILLGFSLVQLASSQLENLKVLSYSWYIDSLGYFDVVGEVQNVGSTTIDPVVLNGTVYTTDGAIQAISAPTVVFVKYMTLQQKAPFFMEFPPRSTATGDLSWVANYDHVDFKVYLANVVTGYQYPDLKIESNSGAVDGEGVYWVSGSVRNSGSKTASNVRVIGTFYNSEGTVVAVGYSDKLSPESLSPSGIASFKVGAFDQNQTIVSSDRRISSYRLLVQTEQPILVGTAPSTSPSDSSSSASSSDSSSSSGSSSPALAPEVQYVALIVIAVIVVVGVLMVLNRRKAGKTQNNKGPKPKTGSKKKTKRK